MRALFFLGVWIIGISESLACMWDRDTLSQEYKAAPGVTEIITGRFERFPPQYYEMRLERVKQEIEVNPGDLALYDDAGVASDRLNLSEEAVSWMAEKKTEMDRQDLPVDHEHRYRYEANLGTFLFHQWLEEGTPMEGLVEAKKGRNHIARAIEINPDAHFGREKYQLMTMDWIIGRVEKPLTNDSPSLLGVAGGHSYEMKLSFRDRELDPDETFRGISGLITLGAAWESIDVQFALLQSLQAQEHGQLTMLSVARIRELQEMGKKSFAAPGPFEEVLKMAVEGMRSPVTAKTFFTESRKEADLWQSARHTFMKERFAVGQHPDTHPKFWDEFRYSDEPPKPPFEISDDSKFKLIGLAAFILVFVIPAIVLFFGIRSLIQSRREKSMAAPA